MSSSQCLLRLRPRPLSHSSMTSISTSSSTAALVPARSALHPRANRLMAMQTTLPSSRAFSATAVAFHPSWHRREDQKHVYPRETNQYTHTVPTQYDWSRIDRPFPIVHRRLFLDSRRWASSLPSEDDDDGYETEDDELLEEDEIFEEDISSANASTETATTTATTATEPSLFSKKKKVTKRQKRKQSGRLDVKFLHFRPLPDEEFATTELEAGFDRLAFGHDLSSFKWISLLEKALVLKLRRENDPETDQGSKASRGRRKKASPALTGAERTRDYWKVALKAAHSTQKVPEALRDHFLRGMVVGAEEEQPPSFERQESATVQDHRDALLLARGRELAVENPLLWRRYSARDRKLRVSTSKKLVARQAARLAATDTGDNDSLAVLAAVEDKSTALDYYLRHVRIPELRKRHHEEKDASTHEAEARKLQQLLRTRLPESSYAKILALVQTYVDCFESKASDHDTAEALHQQKKQQKQFRVLLSNLRKSLPQGRIHWIGTEVAEFFYVTTPDAVDSKQADVIGDDPVLAYSAENWKEVRDQYVRSFWNVRKLFLELERREERERRALDHPEDGLDPSEDPSSDGRVRRTFDIFQELTRMDAIHLSSTQRLKPRTYIPLEAMAVGDYWKTVSRESSGGETDPILEHLAESKAKHQENLNEKESSESITNAGSRGKLIEAPSVVLLDDAFPLSPPVDRLVIVDNLPIDMTERRLQQAYGRCGEIEAIQIFHSRPDLDPGRRATDSTKKIRSPSSKSRKQKWSRPRTPLYAMILYKDPASAQKASCDPLRLFGMVLDQHLMRSHRARDLTTLYLEDVPSAVHTIASMEFELLQLLQPADLYVCLEDGGGQNHHLRSMGGKKKRNSKHLFSYTLAFPSFEAAYWSYWKLSLELQLLGNPTHGPALHWMETPRDAHLYWTRKLNF